MPKVSVIISTWSQNDFRSAVMRESINALLKTAPEAEIIVIDNGGNLSDSIFLLNLCEEKKIACYIRNRNNMSFGYARNQGLDAASGEYIVIADNDILYKQGWLEWCVKILEKADDKYMVTPLRTDRQHRNVRHWKGLIMIDGETYLTNTRAGSNCWMMKRKQYENVGKFEQHRIAGSHWNNKAQDKGYVFITREKDALAQDGAFKKGYNIRSEEFSRIL